MNTQLMGSGGLSPCCRHNYVVGCLESTSPLKSNIYVETPTSYFKRKEESWSITSRWIGKVNNDQSPPYDIIGITMKKKISLSENKGIRNFKINSTKTLL